MAKKNYIPDRGDIAWLDFEPKKGKEVGKYRPALILSSKEYNKQTGLLICCPISTSIRGHQTEVILDKLEQPSIIAASIVQTLALKVRKAKFIIKSDAHIVEDVLNRLLPLIGAAEIL